MNKPSFERYIPSLDITLYISDNHPNVIIARGKNEFDIHGLYCIYYYSSHYRYGVNIYSLPLSLMNGNENIPETKLDFWLIKEWKKICKKRKIKINKNGIATVVNLKKPKVTAIQFIEHLVSVASIKGFKL